MMWSEGGHPDHLTFAGLRGGGGKGGGSTQTQSSTSTTQLPSWLDAASQQAVGMAQNIAATPYQPYTGQIVADPTQATQQAYQQVQAMQGMGMPQYGQDINAYTGMLSQVNPLTTDQINSLSNQLYGNYNQNVTAPATGLLGNYLAGAAPATAQQVGANAQALMSPYTASVLAPTLQLQQQQLAQNLQTIGAGANQAGAFGGARQGVMEGVAQAQSALGSEQYLGGLLNNQWNANLTPATTLATTASGQGMTAAQDITSLLQGGYNTSQAQGQAMAGTNLQAGMTAAGALPGALTSQQTAAQQQASLLQTVGAAQQQQQQAELNAQQGQFYMQQQYPYQQLQAMLAAVGGVPYGSTTDTTGTATQQQQRNVAGGVLGGAASGAAIGTALFPGVGTAIGAVGGGILGAL